MLVLGLVWATGVIVLAGPVVLRNVLIFGKISPFYEFSSNYSMLWEIVREHGRIFVRELSTSELIASWVVNRGVLATGLVVVIASLLVCFYRMSFAQIRDLIKEQRYLILFISYVFANLAAVILVRAVYWMSGNLGGEAQRYFVQIYWTTWLCIALLVTSFFRINRPIYNLAKGALIIVFAMIALLQARLYNYQISLPVRDTGVSFEIGQDAAKLLATEVTDQQIVLSPRAYLLRIYLDINARKLTPRSQCDFQPCFTREDLQRSGQSGVLWGLVIDKYSLVRATAGEYGDLIRGLVTSPQDYPEFERLQINGPAMVFKYIGGTRMTSNSSP